MNSIQHICEAFSGGNLKAAYDHFADNIHWSIVSDKTVQGKENVISCCEQMLIDMGTSKLNNTNIIVQDNSMVVEGVCNFTNENNEPSQVAYCDVYKCDGDKISNITSYCLSFVVKPE